MAHAGAHQGLRNVAWSSAPAGPHQGAARARGTATGTHSRAHSVHGMLSMMPRQRDTQKFTLALWDVSVGHHSRHTMLKVPGLSSPARLKPPTARTGGLGARALVVFKDLFLRVIIQWCGEPGEQVKSSPSQTQPRPFNCRLGITSTSPIPPAGRVFLTARGKVYAGREIYSTRGCSALRYSQGEAFEVQGSQPTICPSGMEMEIWVCPLQISL